MTIATAQEAFDALIRERIGPVLRSAGFTGSGGKFWLEDDESWVLLGFQRSRSSDRDRGAFTINLTVVSKRAWADMRQDRPYLPAIPAPNTRYGTFLWQARIGSLMPGGNDRWWPIGPGTDLAALGADVVSAIERYGLPALRTAMTQVTMPPRST